MKKKVMLIPPGGCEEKKYAPMSSRFFFFFIFTLQPVIPGHPTKAGGTDIVACHWRQATALERHSEPWQHRLSCL